jgi:hypothetical protein
MMRKKIQMSDEKSNLIGQVPQLAVDRDMYYATTQPAFLITVQPS